ncbi:MAG: hypothetical protein LWW81_13435 [Rhodocyclales bacterium]|nr:hypothetical protein [Rhodocyclales bacterium]
MPILIPCCPKGAFDADCADRADQSGLKTLAASLGFIRVNPFNLRHPRQTFFGWYYLPAAKTPPKKGIRVVPTVFTVDGCRKAKTPGDGLGVFGLSRPGFA